MVEYDMETEQVYRGIVKRGRGAGAGEMSSPEVLERFKLLIGIPVIPGTLNIDLDQPFYLTLLDYVSFAEIGFSIDLAKQGIDYNGELGMHYGRIIVADTYPAGVVFFTWADDPRTDAELVSSYHLRSVLHLQDGDTVEFRLLDKEQG
jgi:CTP-dependent riboflavin kinase